MHATKPPPSPSKRPVNLSLDAQLVERAKALGMNVSGTVEALLAAEVERVYWQRWNDDNREAIAHYNARVAREGLPLVRHRSFARGVPDEA